MTDAPLLDLEILTDMRAATRPDAFGRILAVFLEDAEARIARADTLAGAGDLPALSGECHDLIATLGTFGAIGPMETARRAMAAARAGDAPTTRREIGLLAEGIAAMAARLRGEFAPDLAALSPSVTGRTVGGR